jgi:hypothetical protein
MRVFWPKRISRKPGTLLGWLHDDIAVVTLVIDDDSDSDMARLTDASNVDKLVLQAGSLPAIIGTCSSTGRIMIQGCDWSGSSYNIASVS